MRDAFIKSLTVKAKANENIYLLTGDLGFSVFEDFADNFPQRFINMGIAESNMIGVASGLALSGKKVFTYSMIPFSVSRCVEQIKIDVAYQDLDIKIVGVGAGYAYGALGMTHHAIEDIALLRSYPNIKILSPCDAYETKACVELALKTKGAFYLRLGKNKEPELHLGKVECRLGKSHALTKGDDAVIFTTGSITVRALEAERLLRQAGIKVSVISMYSIKPIDKRAIIKYAQGTKHVLTLEEHNIIGGLGSAVGEVILENNIKNVKFKRMGIMDRFSCKVGKQEYLLDEYGLSVYDIKKEVIGLLDK